MSLLETVWEAVYFKNHPQSRSLRKTLACTLTRGRPQLESISIFVAFFLKFHAYWRSRMPQGVVHLDTFAGAGTPWQGEIMRNLIMAVVALACSRCVSRIGRSWNSIGSSRDAPHGSTTLNDKTTKI